MISKHFSRNDGWLSKNTPPHVVTLVLLASISALNMNIFLPSINGMADYFQADYAIVQLAISGYLGVTAILQLIIGPLSDRYGRRIVLLLGGCIFLFATLMCLISNDVITFLIFRMLQASIASGMVLSRAIVRDMVGPAEAASKIGYITMGMALVPMLGPMLGGYLDEQFGWQSSFLMVFIFGALVLLLVWFDLGETNQNQSSSFRAQFRNYPELFGSKRFWGYTFTAAFASGAFFAFLGGAPFVAETVLGLEPVELGFYFGFISLGYMAGNFIAGRFSQSVGLNLMMLLGCATGVVGMIVTLLLFMSGYQTALAFFGSISLVGLGNGMTLPNANAGIVSVRPHLAGSASGLGGTIMIGGGAALSAITGTMLTEDKGASPLIYMMLLSSVIAVFCAISVIIIARKQGELGGEHFAE